MKILTALFSLFLVGFSQAEPDAKPNPLLGKWRWSGREAVVEFLPDGTGKAKYGPSTWKEVPSETVERKFIVTWKGGAVVDELTVSKDGQKLRGKNSAGRKFTSEKINP